MKCLVVSSQGEGTCLWKRLICSYCVLPPPPTQFEHMIEIGYLCDAQGGKTPLDVVEAGMDKTALEVSSMINRISDVLFELCSCMWCMVMLVRQVAAAAYVNEGFLAAMQVPMQKEGIHLLIY